MVAQGAAIKPSPQNLHMHAACRVALAASACVGAPWHPHIHFRALTLHAPMHADASMQPQAGFAYMGGKMDDITVVVARVAHASEVADGPLPGVCREVSSDGGGIRARHLLCCTWGNGSDMWGHNSSNGSDGGGEWSSGLGEFR